MKRLGGLDSAFVTMETPVDHLHMLAVLILDPSTAPDGWSFEHFRTHVARWVEHLAPMRRRVARVPGNIHRAVWVDEPSVDIDRHLRHHVLPAGSGERELAAYASEVASNKLPLDRPLWELHLVDGLGRGRVAVVAKLHHATMDGGMGMAFMASIFTLKPEIVADMPEPQDAPPQPAASAPALLADAIVDLLSLPRAAAAAIVNTAFATVRVADAMCADPGRVSLPFTAPRTPFNRSLTPRRTLAWMSLPLDQVHAVRDRVAGTVNDVVLTVVGGGLRIWLETRGELPESPLIAAVPVSVREEIGTEDANLVSALLTSIGTDVADPIERLRSIHSETRRAKKIHAALRPETFLTWLDVLVPAVTGRFATVYSGMRLADHHSPLCNLLVSNVPGPPVTLYLAGARLEAIHPFGPIYDGLGLNITVLSGADKIDVGLIACPDQIGDLDRLAEDLTIAFDQLASRSLEEEGSRR